jgi:ribosome biogenesis protein Tsr3
MNSSHLLSTYFSGFLVKISADQVDPNDPTGKKLAKKELKRLAAKQNNS